MQVLTPMKSIRKYCLQCTNEQPLEIRLCPSKEECDLWPYRMKKRNIKPKPPRTPVKTIRQKCLNCSANSSLDVKNCFDKNCAIYPYRFGKRPKKGLKN